MKNFIYFIIFLILMSLILSCVSSKPGKKYKVINVEKIGRTNGYKVTTDSFEVVKVVRGMGKYRPDSINHNKN